MMDLTDAEIEEICCGLRQNCAKVRFLERLGLVVRRKPNGKPLVNRNHYDATMNKVNTTKRQPRGVMWSVPA